MSFPRTADEISREREEKDRERDFKTIQNIKYEERKKHTQSIISLHGLGLKSNVNFTPDDWMTEKRNIAIKLKLPDNVKQNMCEIMKSIS